MNGQLPPKAPADGGDPLLGSVVAGKYRVTEAVARGGMGRIYRAVQEPLGKAVALKILTRPVLGTDHDAAGLERRFLLEAATCARLRHPNTVSVFDYGALEVAGESTFFMIMEFVEGRTLAQTLRAGGPMSPTRVAGVMVEIARSLREAHAAGVVHRDLKPSNVMLVNTDEGESVKVLDFGVAKVMAAGTESLTMDGSFVGSPRYAAPEQIRQEGVDGRADLYALGVVAWELLTGAAPFSSPQPMRTLLMHVNDPLPEFLPAQPVPAALETIVRRLLEKSPDARYPDATALIAALRTLRPDLGKSVVEVDATASLRLPPVRASSGWAWAFGGAALLAMSGLLLVGGAAVWWVGQRAPDAPIPLASPAEEVLAAGGGVDAGAALPSQGSAPMLLKTIPSAAEVWIGGARQGDTPFELVFDTTAEGIVPVELELRKLGYKTAPLRLSGPDADGVMEVSLESLPKPDSPRPRVDKPPPPGDDIRLER